MESRSVEVDGIRMRWEEHGEGVPVVFVHGIPTSPALWRGVIPRLEGVRALAWEMVGYGASIPEGRDRDISVGRQAEYLAQWLHALRIERAVLAGHDLGGGVVQIAAVRNPGLALGLFLTNAIGYDSWPIPSVDVMDTMGGLVEHFPEAVFKPIYSSFLRLGHDDQEIASESIKIHWANYAAHDAAEAFIRQVRGLSVHDTLAVRDDLPKLNVPARVVWGEADFSRRCASASSSCGI
jgi:pimeloyl-ACP methyl ester carboxylesterase